ncbi:MAG: acyl-CoA thioesterase [Chitinophagales bacterium]|nr:acyl-CoA thioesterase [Chitinophagales bacterium]HPR28642.1 acyl-CoA thioesterase [Chitinophagales bacterium]HQU40097.1 acyl-CoA thioesterase [Chitinophagales bacterium]HQU76460.1 acyl-CoA thioesterase [Chitinophagales bacterium]HRX23108.1 acyl-CoA thioesterase [Chitinophagales bacterium]
MMHNLQERIDRSVTHTVKAIFPNTTNHYDTLFGGTALAWMDEIAFITATRFSRQKMVTVSSDRVDFKKPVPAGTLAELIGTVKSVGTTSLVIRVEVYLEQMYADEREKAMEGLFTMVAIDDNKHPVPISFDNN